MEKVSVEERVGGLKEGIKSKEQIREKVENKRTVWSVSE